MKNFEKYKSMCERLGAFKHFVCDKAAGCKKKGYCKCYTSQTLLCYDCWLDLEAEEEKPMPCHECGGEMSRDDTKPVHFRLICKKCGVRTGVYETKDEAIAAHNRVCKAVAAYKGSEVRK